MRGNDQQQGHVFSSLSPEQRVRKDHPLRPIRTMVDKVLKELSPEFAKMYSQVGRPSIPPEQLLRALLLQMLYSVRSERLLVEEIDYNILFRWFVGLNLDDEVWDATVFSKNRDRLLEAEVAKEFLALVVEQARGQGWASDEHFTVDGSLLEAWAGVESFQRKNKKSSFPPDDRKRSFLTVHSRCYRRCEFYSGVLISSVKTSSVNALPIARSRRVSNWARVSPSRRTSIAKVLCPSVAMATHPTGTSVPTVISPSMISSAM